jgi:LPXTG-motif cell wall-anchored protein
VTDPTQLPLRDIHLPEPVSWWPPAPGWWLLSGLLLLAIVSGWYWRRRRERLRWSAINLAREELTDIQQRFQTRNDTVECARRLSILLRRLSISLFPRNETAGLTGDKWLAFLDRPMAEKAFTEGRGRLLVEAPYRPAVEKAEVETLLSLCREWIDAVSQYRREAAQ